jgi:hypothetical protein
MCLNSKIYDGAKSVQVLSHRPTYQKKYSIHFLNSQIEVSLLFKYRPCQVNPLWPKLGLSAKATRNQVPHTQKLKETIYPHSRIYGLGTYYACSNTTHCYTGNWPLNYIWKAKLQIRLIRFSVHVILWGLLGFMRKECPILHLLTLLFYPKTNWLCDYPWSQMQLHGFDDPANAMDQNSGNESCQLHCQIPSIFQPQPGVYLLHTYSTPLKPTIWRVGPSTGATA